MMLAFGMVAALLAVKNGAPGQVIDAAMTDGSALLAGMSWHFLAAGINRDEAGVNLLDTGAHFYETYVCADGKYLSVGAIEPQFYALLREKAALTDPAFDAQHDRGQWPALKAKLAAVIATKTREEWAAIFDGTDACVAPVLSMSEAPQHPHNVARGTFAPVGDATQPMPAPRYSVTENQMPQPSPKVGADTAAVLASIGYSDQQIAALTA
jgi:alpha-methylacyl-CoA racemase